MPIVVHFEKQFSERYLCRFICPTHASVSTSIRIQTSGVHHHTSLYRCSMTDVPNTDTFECTTSYIPGCKEMIYTFGSNSTSMPSDISFRVSDVILLQLHSLGPAATVSLHTWPAAMTSLPVRFVEIGPRIVQWNDHVRGTCPSKCRQTSMFARYALLHMHSSGLRACVSLGTRRYCVDQKGLNTFNLINLNISRHDELHLECHYARTTRVPVLLSGGEMCFLHLLAASSAAPVFQCWSDEMEWTCNS
jgi:hypothetical protein